MDINSKLCNHQPHPTARRRPGFSLIELIATMSLIGLLSALAIPRYRDISDRARVAQATADIRAIHADIISQDSLPASLAAIGRDTKLDPWGRPYVYVTLGSGSGARTKNGSAVNSTFDLYSLGRDGASALPLSAAASEDDIVRANDGGYFGLAKSF